MFVHCCHCTECQRQTGGAFAVNALIEADRIAVRQGAIREVMLPTESGGGLATQQCGECGAVLWMYYPGAGRGVAFLRAGTLDEPAACPPDIHIFTRSKQAWVRLPDGVLAVEGYYPMRETWPEDRFARLLAAKKAAGS
ncbi:GFA family protein [Parasphingopyxis sp. GrpM-11]|uniref:GFA family protein n=2 Tax=Parasphingopyxis marina TaxID=2761622 RepID=A0A842HX18_9SPHN|nr:GFA family protein [Parasphingopyxis marina]